MSLLELLLDLLVCFWEPKLFQDQEWDAGCLVVLGLTLVVMVGVAAILYSIS
jgi:hypothetical protein